MFLIRFNKLPSKIFDQASTMTPLHNSEGVYTVYTVYMIKGAKVTVYSNIWAEHYWRSDLCDMISVSAPKNLSNTEQGKVIMLWFGRSKMNTQFFFGVNGFLTAHTLNISLILCWISAKYRKALISTHFFVQVFWSMIINNFSKRVLTSPPLEIIIEKNICIENDMSALFQKKFQNVK